MKTVTLVSLVGVLTLVMASLYFAFRPFEYKAYSFSTSSDTHSSAVSENGDVIMGFVGNKTERAELGRTTWKFLHTMMARYPENPTQQERQSLHDFMILFSRFYPCGECAVHFNKLLKTYPPQTSSRLSASRWLCPMHNKVNGRVHKPIFDCKDIESKYPCGCADDTNSITITEQISISYLHLKNKNLAI